jgi:hypothetical protein
MGFLAYFDYLGFKDFIEKNEPEYQKKIVNNIFRDIEGALGQGKVVETEHGYIADLSDLRINCINFSDTVIFWTDANGVDNLNDLLGVALRFNWTCIDYFFPVRGCIVFDDIIHYKFDHVSKKGGTYGVNSIIGKGLVKAHQKAESQNWAGTVIDDTILKYLEDVAVNVDEFLSPYAKPYKVPYHSDMDNEEEWVLHLVTSKGKMHDEAFQNMCRNITENFAAHNKRTDSASVQIKLKNTIAFLRSYM